jgi:DNA polymerase I
LDMGFSYSEDKVIDLINDYFKKFPGIYKYREDTVAYAYRNRFIKTKLGRRMVVLPETEKNSLYNYPIQATASDGFKLALLYIDKELSGLDARVVHLLHDEVIVEARDDIAEDVKGIVKKCMEEALKRLVPEVPFVVKPEVRMAWGKLA